MSGDYYFSSIGRELMQVLQPHLPSLIAAQDQSVTRNNNFQLNLLIKNTEDLSFAFGLPAYNVEHATLKGTVNMASDEPLLIEGYLPRLMMGNSDIRETRLDLQTNVSNGIGLNVNSYLVQDNGFINVRLDSDAAGNKLDNHIFIDLEQ